MSPFLGAFLAALFIIISCLYMPFWIMLTFNFSVISLYVGVYFTDFFNYNYSKEMTGDFDE